MENGFAAKEAENNAEKAEMKRLLQQLQQRIDKLEAEAVLRKKKSINTHNKYVSCLCGLVE